MFSSEMMTWQPEFTDKTLSRKPGAVQMKAKSLPPYLKKRHSTSVTIVAMANKLARNLF